MNYAKNMVFPSSNQVAEKAKNMFSGKLSRKAHLGKSGFKRILTNALESPNPTRTFYALSEKKAIQLPVKKSVILTQNT